MATVNFWKRFEQLIPGGVRVVATVLSVNTAAGTSIVKLRGGNSLQVQGTTVPVAGNAFIKDGQIVGAAPSLPQYQVTI